MLYQTILKNNARWRRAKITQDPNFFTHLAQGQSPEVLYIGCSDSRVTAEELMGLHPGELFVHRNIANLVVGTDNNLNAVVQMAVQYLKVKHIIVCGHYDCGGIKMALRSDDMGQLNSWLQNIRDVYRLHRPELDMIEIPRKREDRLVELNVLEQCMNIMKIDHVQRAWRERHYPHIHGWVFDVYTGELIDLNLNTREMFEQVSNVYTIR